MSTGTFAIKPGFLSALLGVAALTACGAQPSTPATRVTADALTTENGLSMNGLSMNGLSMNGLSMNGLSMNGLSMNGLSMNGLATATFSSWFHEDASRRSILMKYFVRCAYPAGEVLTWIDPSTNASYSWTGVLGLLPGWASGQPLTETEGRVLTACLAAHANAFGVHVDIAVEGRDAAGVQMPIGPTELSDYPVREAAFFGDIVAGSDMFVCADHPAWEESISSSRSCALHGGAPGSTSTLCAPIVHVGTCDTLCQPDATNTFYETCTWGGVAYPALATRMRPASVYSCGDGVCQFTESCGASSTYDSCEADCGPCP